MPGALGLVLWANSAVRAAAPLTLLAEAGFGPAELELALPGITTMEVAWLVSGLLHAGVPALRPATIAALRELESRLDRETLVFRPCLRRRAAAPRLRRRIANFADQAFRCRRWPSPPSVLGDPDRRLLADRCGARLVAAQGPLGQWWWHHDAGSGEVAERLPGLCRCTSTAWRRWRCARWRWPAAAPTPRPSTSSRAWLHANELGLDLVEPASGIIWRSIEREEGPTARRLRQPACWPACRGRSRCAPRLPAEPGDAAL